MPRRPARRNRAASEDRSPGWLSRLAPLVIVLAGAAAYGNSLHGPFIFDDYPSIQINATIRRLWPITHVLSMARDTPDPTVGRPLANLSFALNYAFGGLQVEGYHVTNVSLHMLAALILYGILRRTIANPAAFVCALLWVVHPLNSEAVDYVAQRMESMAGLLWLLTLYAAIRGLDGKQSRRWHVLAVVACACGVATKESVVTAPLIVVLYDRVFVFESFRASVERRGRLYAALAACWLLFAALVLYAPFFRSDAFYSPGNGFGARVSSWTYLLNQPSMILIYLHLSVLPRALVLDYGAPAPVQLLDVWPAALLVLTLLALTLAALTSRPRTGFWAAWFFMSLAPASSIIALPTEVGAERRMYLPLIAVIVLVVLAVRAFAERLASVGTRVQTAVRIATVLGAAMATTGFILATRQRNTEYRSAISIWQTVIDRRPNPRAHVNLAAVLGEAGRIDESLAHLRIAAPDFVDARRVLGLELLLQGDNRGAIAQLSEFARAAPNDRDILQVRRALAAAYVRNDEPGEARRQLEIITTHVPDDAVGHLDLADVLLSMHDADGAVAQYRECFRLQPDNVAMLRRLEGGLKSAAAEGARVESLLAAVTASLARASAR